MQHILGIYSPSMSLRITEPTYRLMDYGSNRDGANPKCVDLNVIHGYKDN